MYIGNDLRIFGHDSYAERCLSLYGGVLGVLYIGIHQFLIKIRCCTEVSAEKCMGIYTGIFS